MMFCSGECVAEVRRAYPRGARVRLVRMNDVQAPPIGTLGTVDRIDTIGTIHVKWDNGSTLGVLHGEDLCQ